MFTYNSVGTEIFIKYLHNIKKIKQIKIKIKPRLDKPRFGNILSGNYTDFNADWFKNIGGTLCLTVFLNVITPHIAKILLPLIHYLIQLYDRGF